LIDFLSHHDPSWFWRAEYLIKWRQSIEQFFVGVKGAATRTCWVQG